MAAKQLRYWEYDRDATVSCTSCDWSGRAGDNEELFDQLLDVRCAQCDQMLLIVSFPTPDDTRQAARDGNPEAIAELSSLDQREARWVLAKEVALTDPNELPDLPGSEVRIDWDFVQHDDDYWTVLRHDGQEIWRELAYFEGWPRFAEVLEILRARYGARLKELHPTKASYLYLYGDDLRSIAAVDKLNASLLP